MTFCFLSQDYSWKGQQNADKTFRPLEYGRTVFIGQSVRQRELITARAFDICIIVEGEFNLKQNMIRIE